MATEEEQEVGVGGMDCFMDDGRVCNAACMAYSTFPRSSKDGELSEQQSHCVLLSSAERVGKHLVIIAGMMAEETKRKKVAQQDLQRAASTVPQGPFASPLPAGKEKP